MSAVVDSAGLVLLGGSVGAVSTTGQALAMDGPLITSKSVVWVRFIIGLLVKGAALQQVD